MPTPNEDSKANGGPRGLGYIPDHPVTPNYRHGLWLMAHQQPGEALVVLLAEPTSSSCYGLALANAALARIRLEDYENAAQDAQRAVTHFGQDGCPHPPTAVQAFRTIGDALASTERPLQSLNPYLAAVKVADELIAAEPSYREDLLREKAFTLTHLGGTCLRIEQFQSAVDYLTEARTLYRAYPNDRVGRPEALQNLAEAYRQLNKPDEAGYALDEALSILGLYPEQRTRIQLTRLRLVDPPIGESRTIVETAVGEALANGQVELAVIRYSMGIAAAVHRNEIAWASELLARAESLEPRLPANTLLPAKLRFYRAVVMGHQARPSEEIRNVLIDGAHRWCSMTAGRVELPDYQFHAGKMHDHFRLLARKCLDDGMIKEAFVSFETGRARAILAEMRHGLTHPMVATSPFSKPGNIDLDFLANLQAGLPPDSVVITIAALPPTIACFVVARETIHVAEIAISPNLVTELTMLPTRLEAGVGERAIPTSVMEMAKQIAALVGTRSVRAIVPHRIFHRAPWRALLRHANLGWNQLSFGVSFSPALASRPALLATSCRALGYGTAANGLIDLNDEARDFAALFGAQGVFVRDATKSDFKSALASSATLLVSCHGRLANEPLGPRVTFKLSGGWTGLEEVLSDTVTSPLVILSACDSGAYDMIEGDYPVGAAPQLLLKGAAYCACSRFPINADFARRFFNEFGRNLIAGEAVEHALASASKEMESKGADLWRDLACVELLVRGD